MRRAKQGQLRPSFLCSGICFHIPVLHYDNFEKHKRIDSFLILDILEINLGRMTMPDREVKTIRELLYYQYAKLVARSAFKLPDGVAVKKSCYGFIKNTFRDLRDGRKQWSDILREDWQAMEAARVCQYCGVADGLTHEHIVAGSLRINDRCSACDTIQGIHNQVWACRSCNSSMPAGSRSGTTTGFPRIENSMIASRRCWKRSISRRCMIALPV